MQGDELLFLGLTDFDDKTLDTIPELAPSGASPTMAGVDVQDAATTFSGSTMTGEQRRSRPRARHGHDVVYQRQSAALIRLPPRTMATSTISSKNGEAVNTGEITDLDSVGVRAVDDYTVEFTLEQPAGYFPGIAGMWVNRPVPKTVIEQYGDSWTEPGNIWTNGPYLLDTWEHENRIVMLKNPYYYSADTVQIAYQQVMVTEDSTRVRQYENGECNVQNPPLDDMDASRRTPCCRRSCKSAGCASTTTASTPPRPRSTTCCARRSLRCGSPEADRHGAEGEQKPAFTFAPSGILVRGGRSELPGHRL